jgi:hypothetical protein
MTEIEEGFAANNPPAKQAVKAMGCILVNLGQTACFERFHIGAEKLQNRSKFTL